MFERGRDCEATPPLPSLLSKYQISPSLKVVNCFYSFYHLTPKFSEVRQLPLLQNNRSEIGSQPKHRSDGVVSIVH